MTQTIEPVVLSERERLLSEHVEDINAVQTEFLKCAKTVGSGMLAGANYRRELGIKLAALKAAEMTAGDRKMKVVPHGEWEGLFASANGKPNPTPLLDFDSQTGRRYIAFAERFPNPIESLEEIAREGKDMLLDAGEIEAEEGGNPGRLLNANEAAWMTALTKGVEQLAKLKEKEPDVRKWPESTQFTVREKLRPMVELYEALGGRAA